MERGDRRGTERVRADWSARFEAGDTAIAGRVVDVSVVSVRIRADFGDDARVSPGLGGTLTLAFSDSTRHMEVIRLAATVVRAAADGIALTFAGLPESANRWLGARVLTTEVRRRAPRVPLTLPIELRAARRPPFTAEMLDLSAFGARVRARQSPQPLAPGDRLQAKMHLATGPPIAVSALVWSVEGDEAVLMFVNLEPREFNRLGDQVASRLHGRG